MKLIKTDFKNLFILEPERIEDSRGFFARTWSKEEFKKLNLVRKIEQTSISFNKYKHTIRGMHFQFHPYQEVKLVRCTMGRILDVVVDVRPQSSTYLKYFSVELSQKNRRQLYIPKGFAHGYQTLEDNTEVYYQISAPFMPSQASGIRYDDPAVGIRWPHKVTKISEKDKKIQLIRK